MNEEATFGERPPHAICAGCRSRPLTGYVRGEGFYCAWCAQGRKRVWVGSEEDDYSASIGYDAAAAARFLAGGDAR